MPVTKRKLFISELLDIAVERRRKIRDSSTEILKRSISTWIQSCNDQENCNEYMFFRTIKFLIYMIAQLLSNIFNLLSVTYDARQMQSEIFVTFITLSWKCTKILHNKYFIVGSIVVWLLCFLVLAYEVSKLHSNIDNIIDHFYYLLDIFVNVSILIESTVRIASLITIVNIERICNRKFKGIDILLSCGILDFISTCFCFSTNMNLFGLWFRFIRFIFISVHFISHFSHVSALINGIFHGIKSISLTIMIFALALAIYASLGHLAFRINDPLHFGTYALSLITFLQLSTFDNWSSIFYINSYGCDSFPGEYYGSYLPHSGLVTTDLGTFRLPDCSQPMAQPLLSCLVFISFSIVEGYIVVSMCLAAVTTGINEQFDSLRKEKLLGEDAEERQNMRRAILEQLKHRDANKTEKILGKQNDVKIMLELATVIWSGSYGLVKPSQRRAQSYSLRAYAVWLWRFVSAEEENWFIAGWVVLDAAAQLGWQITVSEPQPMTWLAWALLLCSQVVFSGELLLRLYRRAAEPRELLSPLNGFDTPVTLLLFLPLAAQWAMPLLFLRPLRLMRLLKTFSFVSDVGFILSAVSSSFQCLLYVMLLQLYFFLYFAIAGVLLFKESAPYYFSTVLRSMFTLFQIMTLDNWSDVMRKAMYGCRRYGFYHTGAAGYDASCSTHGGGSGYWAPLYFCCFIILSAMVLTSLLIGVIITSMEFLREGGKATEEMWDKVKEHRLKYEYDPSTEVLFLSLFEKIDLNGNGLLSFEELRPFFEVVQIPSLDQYSFFLSVDTDHSGQIDFSEFCEMILLIGCMKKNAKNKLKEKYLHLLGNKGLLRLPSSMILCPEAPTQSPEKGPPNGKPELLAGPPGHCRVHPIDGPDLPIPTKGALMDARRRSLLLVYGLEVQAEEGKELDEDGLDGECLFHAADNNV